MEAQNHLIEENLKTLQRVELEKKTEVCAPILDCLMVLPQKTLELEVKTSIKEFEHSVARYCSSDVIDEIISDNNLMKQLKEMKKDVSNLKKKKVMSSFKGFVIRKKPLVRQLIPSISYNLYRNRLNVEIGRNHRISVIKSCNRISRMVTTLKGLISRTSEILIKRAAGLDKIVIDNEEDFKVACKAKKAGFTGMLTLTASLSMSQAHAIEKTATRKGFQVYIRPDLGRKRKSMTATDDEC